MTLLEHYVKNVDRVGNALGDRIRPGLRSGSRPDHGGGSRPHGGISDDRGDVPGWVLITLMTAGLVIIIWGLAGPALSAVFQQAIDRVTSF